MISLQSLAIFVVFSTFSVFLVEVKSAALVDIKQHDNPQPKALTYLGNVGSKQIFVGDRLMTWRNAQDECWNYGMKQVTIITEAEYEFIQRKILFDGHGPVWLGARDIGSKSMYRWSEDYGAPVADDPTTQLGSFVNFYHYVEQGPLALVMSSSIGSPLYGVHAFQPAAKAFCQSG